MKLYISFGQEHTHRVNNQTMDKDCIGVIECEDYADGRRIAFELFDVKFATIYSEKQIENSMHFFHRGKIAVN